MKMDFFEDAHAMAVFTWSACDLQITNISWTPASDRLSKVQSRRGALHIGNRHCESNAYVSTF